MGQISGCDDFRRPVLSQGSGVVRCGVAGRIAVVDAANRFVRWEDRRVVHQHQLVHRSAYVAVLDRAGRLLVQRRHRAKLTFPACWDVSCAGHVEESDYREGPDDDLDTLYAACARRELAEELGLEAPLHLLERCPPVFGVHYEWMHLFVAAGDGPFTLQADEVEEARQLDRAGLAALLAGDEPVTPVLRWVVDRLDQHGWQAVVELACAAG
jgi:isopentenyl-diphosphate delta-isomerase